MFCIIIMSQIPKRLFSLLLCTCTNMIATRSGENHLYLKNIYFATSWRHLVTIIKLLTSRDLRRDFVLHDICKFLSTFAITLKTCSRKLFILDLISCLNVHIFIKRLFILYLEGVMLPEFFENLGFKRRKNRSSSLTVPYL